jgi:hypothetical protein
MTYLNEMSGNCATTPHANRFERLYCSLKFKPLCGAYAQNNEKYI